MQKRKKTEHADCVAILRPIRDALDTLNGKWKLPIIVALTFGEKRFKELSKEIEGITDRMLSKELKSLEINGLVERTIEDSYPIVVRYSLTDQSKSLEDVIESLKNFGIIHRLNITKQSAKPKMKSKK